MSITVGPQTLTDGGSANSRGGKSGEVIYGGLHPKYYEAAYRNTLFSGSIVGQVTSVGLATAYTGLVLSNPVNSTVNLVLSKVGVAMLVANAAAAAVGIMTGYNQATNVTHTTPVTTRSQKFGSTTASTGTLDSSATLPTAPTLNQILGAATTAAITTNPAGFGGMFDLDGSIVLVPGAYAAIYTSTASGTASCALSFTWEEVPV